MVTKKNILEKKETYGHGDGSENLGVTDMFVGDGFDLVHKHGDNHLSDLSPDEDETLIPKGTKKVKNQVFKTKPEKGPLIYQ